MNFEAPIDVFKIAFDITDAPENQLGTKGRKFKFRDFDFSIRFSPIPSFDIASKDWIINSIKA
jgi:hypothetical protein